MVDSAVSCQLSVAALKAESFHDPSDLPTNRRVVDDLDAIAVRIAEVARPRAVAVGLRLRVELHAAALEKGGPAIDLLRRSHNQAQMVERRPAAEIGERGNG